MFRSTDASVADWIPDPLDDRSPGTKNTTLKRVLPAGFDAYVRILHPALRPASRDTGTSAQGTSLSPVPWAEVAADHDVLLHRQSQWMGICGGVTGVPDYHPTGQRCWVWPPEEGVLEPRTTALTVLDILRRHTSPQTTCYCGFWSGYAGIEQVCSTTSQFDAIHSTYYLSETTFAEFVAHYQRRPSISVGPNTPDMVWPEDRRWFLTSPYYLCSSYVGGSLDLADALCTSANLECFTVLRTDEF